MASKFVLLRKVINAGAVLIEDAIDRIGDRDGSRIMREALVKARDRAAELAVENSTLHDRIEEMNRKLDDLQDRFAFNGPTLYSDELEALRGAADMFTVRSIPSGATTRKWVENINALIGRSDHCPFTAVDLQKQIHGIISGETEVIPWHDPRITTAPTVDWQASEVKDDDIPF